MPIRREIVDTTAKRIVDYNPKRTSLLIQNASGVDVYIYPGPKEVAEKGLVLMAGQAFSINILTEKTETKNAWYARTTAGIADVRIFEDFE
jgi:hypothetical protein